MAKKKILLLADDLRMSSGVGTMSKEFVLGTLHHYDWVQIGGAVKHPEQGKVIDMSKAAQNDWGVEDAYLKLYPINSCLSSPPDPLIKRPWSFSFFKLS